MARVIKFDVGGIPYKTSISTIAQYPDSMLAIMIQQHEEQKLIHEGVELFIDRNGHLFKYVLEFLRNGNHMVLPDDECTLRELLLEAEFFQLDGLKSLISKKINDSLLEYKPGDLITAADLTALYDLKDLLKYNRLGDLIGTVVGMTGRGDVVVKFSGFLSNLPYGEKPLEDFREVSALFAIPLKKLKPKTGNSQ